MTRQEQAQKYLDGCKQEARKQGATHVIIVCDTFNDYKCPEEDYPIFVMPGDNLDEIVNSYPFDMQSIHIVEEIKYENNS